MTVSDSHLRTISQDAVSARTVSGLTILIGREGESHLLVYGHRQVEPVPLPATDDTIWDLASLTKPLVTSLLCMGALERAAITLDEPLGAEPDGEPPAGQGQISLTAALSHSAGFPAHVPFTRRPSVPAGPGAGTVSSRAAVVQAAARVPLAYPPGTRSIYSDVGFILLGDFLERRLGSRLDVAAADVFASLGITSLAYRPIGELGSGIAGSHRQRERAHRRHRTLPGARPRGGRRGARPERLRDGRRGRPRRACSATPGAWRPWSMRSAPPTGARRRRRDAGRWSIGTSCAGSGPRRACPDRPGGWAGTGRRRRDRWPAIASRARRWGTWPSPAARSRSIPSGRSSCWCCRTGFTPPCPKRPAFRGLRRALNDAALERSATRQAADRGCATSRRSWPPWPPARPARPAWPGGPGSRRCSARVRSSARAKAVRAMAGTLAPRRPRGRARCR